LTARHRRTSRNSRAIRRLIPQPTSSLSFASPALGV